MSYNGFTCSYDWFPFKMRKFKLTGKVAFLVGIPDAKSQQSEQEQSHDYTSNNPTSVYVTLKKQGGEVRRVSSGPENTWRFTLDGGSEQHLRTSILAALQRWTGPALFAASQ